MIDLMPKSCYTIYKSEPKTGRIGKLSGKPEVGSSTPLWVVFLSLDQDAAVSGFIKQRSRVSGIAIQHIPNEPRNGISKPN